MTGIVLLTCMVAFADEPSPESGTEPGMRAVKAPPTDDELIVEIQNDDLKKAIDAAWTLTCRRGIQFRDVRPGFSSPMSEKHLGWFLGVLDTRLPCHVPKWWGESIANAGYVETPAPHSRDSSSRHLFDLRDKDSPYTVLEEATSDEVSLAVGDSVYYNDNDTHRVHFERNGNSVQLPFELLSGDPEKGVPFSGTAKVFSIHGDILYFCDVGPDRCDYVTLRAFDCVRQTKLWSCVICGGQRAGNRHPIFSAVHYIDIIVSMNRLYVFGVHQHAAYIECHDLQTGIALWAFTTADWPEGGAGGTTE